VKIGIMAGEFVGKPLPVIFAKAKEYGARAVELVLEDNLPLSQIPEVKKLSKQFDIEVCAVNNRASVLMADVEADIREAGRIFNESITMAVELAAPIIVTYTYSDIIKDAEDRDILDKYSSRLEPFVKRCEREGITLAIENEPCGLTQTARGMRSLVEYIGSTCVRINYDPDNFYNGGEEGFPYSYEILKDFIVYVHAKDSTKYIENRHSADEHIIHRYIDALCVSVGRGALNWEGLMQRLKADGYNGSIVIEPHTKPARLDRTFIAGVKYLEAKLAG